MGLVVSRDNVTPDQLRRMVGGEVFTDRRGRVQASRASTSKLHNRRAYLPAIDRWFASQRERDAAAALLVRQQRGEIQGLRFQVRYPLAVNGVTVCAYVADFVFEEWALWRPLVGRPQHAWLTVVADAKGFRTDLYRIKKRLMLAIYNIEIREL